MPSLQDWEDKFHSHMAAVTAQDNDPAHDMNHIMRVVENARHIGAAEGGKPDVYIPAAWLHDLVNLPKNHPDRAKASTLAAEGAVIYLRDQGYPNECLDDIAHAIAAHSFSAAIETQTLEARIVQDADRLDALGAIGIMRTFSVSGQLNRPFYDASDPFAEERDWNDGAYALDHFWVKLFKVADSMKTEAGRIEAQARLGFMRGFIAQLKQEI